MHVLISYINKNNIVKLFFNHILPNFWYLRAELTTFRLLIIVQYILLRQSGWPKQSPTWFPHMKRFIKIVKNRLQRFNLPIFKGNSFKRNNTYSYILCIYLIIIWYRIWPVIRQILHILGSIYKLWIFIYLLLLK